MPHPTKKRYASGSPGFLREMAGLTLASIKKQIAASSNKAKTRKAFCDNGYLGRGNGKSAAA